MTNPRNIASLAALASQVEMEAGTETGLRAMTPARVKQAITALAPQGSGAGGRTITGNVTLTAINGIISDAAISVVPANPGLYVTLPVGTTVNEAAVSISIYNNGDYDYGVKDSAGTVLGWVRPRTGAIIGLADNATSAGVWAPYGLEKTGITASYVNSTVANMGSTIRRIALDANRTCFLFGGVDCYAIVYDASTQTWGTATLVRASVRSGIFLGVLSATNQVLVCSCDSTTGFEAVTLTIATNTVTVNTGTKATTVLAGNSVASGFGQLIAVSTSWVISYGRDTTTSALRALTVSGTTPTIGAESALTPAVTTAANLYVSGSVVRAVNASASVIYAKPFTVSTSNLSAGTEASATVTAAAFRAFLNGNGNIVCQYINTTHFATIFKLTGTVEAASSVSLGTVTTSIIAYNDYGVITASKTLFTGIVLGATWYANILTDTGGTATAGTELSGTLTGGSVNAGIPVFNVTGNTAYVVAAMPGQSSVLTLNCSGATPTLTSVTSWQVNSASTVAFLKSSDKYGVRLPRQISAGNYIRTIAGSWDGTTVTDCDFVYAPNSIYKASPLPIFAKFGNFTGVSVNNNESWINEPYVGAAGQVIQRVECAA